jgi:hypothetical protein
MASDGVRRKLHGKFTRGDQLPGASRTGRGHGRSRGMAGLAMIMFIALFAFGGQYFGWTDSTGHVQLALFSAFVFGIICGIKVKG